MVFPIDVSMVNRFEINQFCNQRLPCDHKCKITLQDNREETFHIGCEEILILIKTIAKEKIINNSSVEHLSYYEKNYQSQINRNVHFDALQFSNQFLTDLFNWVMQKKRKN